MQTYKLMLIGLCLIPSMALANYFPFDEGIEDHIESEVTLSQNITDEQVEVESHDGIVTLEGEVSTRADADEIIDIANSTAGVFIVDVSKLTVRNQE